MTQQDISSELGRDSLRQNLRIYTLKAFHMIPPVYEPRILDLGCGTGVPCLELAINSKGLITAVDRDLSALCVLKEKTKALNLQKHVKAVRADIMKKKWRRNSFDIIWFEGSMAVFGFEKAVSRWRGFLKHGGYMVIHDEKEGYEDKIGMIPACGLELQNRFFVSVDIWLDRYFRPLDEKIEELRERYAGKSDVLAMLDQEASEINRFRDDPNRFASIFYIMKKV
ncbi:MAG: class I SAM-dependent methyltransferase [Spirochaetaceae bacterium]|nr:MAG: class I SAM-dependent methyltransferase [Spirochaetaceae bacterium]